MTPELAEKLFIAFAGAAVALILKAVYDEVKETLQRRAFRKSIEHNVKDVLVPKTERLISDYEQVRRVIMSTSIEQYNVERKMQLDQMPMFNSDLLKRLPPQEVYRCLNVKAKYGLLFEAFYSIDYHREKMPRAILDSFYKQNLEHFKLSSDREEDETYIDHMFHCTYADALRENLNDQITMRVGSARELLEELKKLQRL